MTIDRRRLVAGGLAAPVLLGLAGAAQAAGALKISHQFPGGTIEQGDFRDRLCRRFAAAIAARSNGEMSADIYPNSSLMKTFAQFSALRKGALDFTLLPLAYAGGEVPETNIGLMPSLVSNYAQGMAWKSNPIGKELTDFLASKGVVIVTWIWQAGGAATRARPLVGPEDAKGQKLRGGSREMDMVLQAAGAAVLSLPSNELYAAMQTGACDGGVTSSTSLISFRLEELAKNLTTGRGGAYWFMFEPLLMSKAVFDKMPKAAQDLIMAVGAQMEAFALEAAKADDIEVANVYQKAGAAVFDLDRSALDRWQAIARDTAWKDFSEKSASTARFMKLALDVQG